MLLVRAELCVASAATESAATASPSTASSFPWPPSSVASLASAVAPASLRVDTGSEMLIEKVIFNLLPATKSSL
jgi:hypothetical protein